MQDRNIIFSGPSCPSEFNLVSGSCFFISQDRVGWIEARKMCEKKGARLISLQTLEKKDSLVNLVSSLSRRRRGQYWLAGNDIEDEGVWEWAKLRSPVPQFGWREDPYNSPEENCLAWTVDIQKGRQSTDFWQGSSCCNNLRYICEM